MSAPAPSAADRRAPLLPRRLWQVAIDCGVILLVHAMATLAFGPVFGGVDFAIAGIGGAIAGILVGIVSSLRPLRGWLVTVAGVVVAYVVVGPALAVRHATIGGVIPTIDGLRELMLGSFVSWRSLLTAQPPVQGFPSLLVVPMLTMLVCATVATVLALRLRRGAAWAMLPGVVALVVGIAFGTRIAAQPILLGVVTACASIAWIAWRGATARRNLAEEVEVTRDDANRRAFARRRLIGGVGMVAAAALVASLAAVPVAFTDRQVLRDDVEPPIELADYPSPLAGFRTWHKNFEEATLLTVSGMPEGSRLRLATLDWYDGTVYAVAGSQESSASGSFSRVGDAIGTSQPGTPAQIQVQIEEYSGVWVPSVGYAERIDFAGDDAVALQSSLAYNGLTGNVLAESGLGPGDSYTIDAIVPEVPEDYADLEGIPASEIDMPEPEDMPELITAWSASNATERTTLDNILAMAATLQQGAFSHGVGDDEATSLAGHGQRRLTSMFDAETLLGDDEQYAAAFSLALDFYGVPSRVVMGMYPGEDGFDGEGEAVELTGGDMHAWVEVSFQGVGWVPFDPTPPEDNTQVEPEPQPQPDPRPQVLQPPQPPEEPAELLPNTQPDQADDDEEDQATTGWLIVLAVAGIILGVLLLLALPFLVIGLLKRRRRRKRFEAATESERLAGGWHQVVDEAVDLGLPVPAGVTRREVASSVEDRYPRSRATAIGEYVDAGVFGPGEPHKGEIDAFWKDVDRSVQAMRQEASRRSRILGMLSLRSFLRRRAERRSR
ncbi:transglutaminase-like domain-containing protein [Agrococcus versicolor]|uniref:Transglutaminase-like domain-containing protein n=1 Tax=Agrococcus versicolor TaxID=501482 RepID=A0ABN3AKQ1_9MICO